MPDSSAVAVNWVEQGLVPDRVIRLGIRRLLKARLSELHSGDAVATAALTQAFIDELRAAPLALLPEKANEQHYEVPAAFFGAVLGTHRKYSSCYWGEGDAAVHTLAQAEAAALQLTCERSGLTDGQQVLELGCGWGSLSLWMAERFPGEPHHGTVELALAAAAHRGPGGAARADESARGHLRHQRVRHRGSLRPRRLGRDVRASAQLAAGVRARRALAAPARALLHARVRAPRGAVGLRRTRRERLDEPALLLRRHDAQRRSPAALPGRLASGAALALGRHALPAHREAWLRNMVEQRDALMPLFERSYGPESAAVWWMRWRLFFMSVADLFGWADGQQWWVSHYLFDKRA